MSHKETVELCQEAIDGWKETQDFFIEKAVPLEAFFAFTLGSFNKKKRKDIKKRIPEVYGSLMEDIEKGRKLVLAKFCRKCNINNDPKANFCQKCGKKLMPSTYC